MRSSSSSRARPDVAQYAGLAATITKSRLSDGFRRAGAAGDLPTLQPDTALYAWAGTGGVEPTPVTDPAAGVITIDVFGVWKPLIGPVSWFNLRNGAAFDRQPGCHSPTVLRGLPSGRIATYTHWRTPEDFLSAFGAVSGGPGR